MVFGPLLDSYTARKEGVTTVHVLSRGNRIVAAQLPVPIKLAFWLTNLPYWFIAITLAADPPELVPDRGLCSSTNALAIGWVQDSDRTSQCACFAMPPPASPCCCPSSLDTPCLGPAVTAAAGHGCICFDCISRRPHVWCLGWAI